MRKRIILREIIFEKRVTVLFNDDITSYYYHFIIEFHKIESKKKRYLQNAPRNYERSLAIE